MSILEPPVKGPSVEQQGERTTNSPEAGGRTRSELRCEAAATAEPAAGLSNSAGAKEEPAPEPGCAIAWRQKEKLGVGQRQEKMSEQSFGTNAGKV